MLRCSICVHAGCDVSITVKGFSFLESFGIFRFHLDLLDPCIFLIGSSGSLLEVRTPRCTYRIFRTSLLT